MNVESCTAAEGRKLFLFFFFFFKFLQLGKWCGRGSHQPPFSRMMYETGFVPVRRSSSRGCHHADGQTAAPRLSRGGKGGVGFAVYSARRRHKKRTKKGRPKEERQRSLSFRGLSYVGFRLLPTQCPSASCLLFFFFLSFFFGHFLDYINQAKIERKSKVTEYLSCRTGRQVNLLSYISRRFGNILQHSL